MHIREHAQITTAIDEVYLAYMSSKAVLDDDAVYYVAPEEISWLDDEMRLPKLQALIASRRQGYFIWMQKFIFLRVSARVLEGRNSSVRTMM